VRDILEAYLPTPVVVRDGERFRLEHDRPKSIGRVRGFGGPFGVFVRAYAFIRSWGPGLRDMSEIAVLNANYMLALLKDDYELPYDRHCMHEFVLSARGLKREYGATALDVAKRLMDYGFHAPTVSFPVAGTLMIEPTESEPKAELDRFCEALIAIRAEIQAVIDGTADRQDNLLKNAPHTAAVATADTWSHPYTRQQAVYPLPFVRARKTWPSVGRIDNARGDRQLVCTCPPISEYE
jgi:glycine dehydrogenase